MLKLKIRKDLSGQIQRIVIKVGSAAITQKEGGIERIVMQKLVADIAHMVSSGLEVVLVSSGAINAGRSFLGSATKNSDIGYLQACSAVGQPLLMASYQKEFEKFGLLTAQVLLTHDDLKNRTRNLNTRNAILKLLSRGIIPILNENDSVSFEEITVGDNDQLAAMVTELIDGQALILLTGPDGLYDRDPDIDGATHFPVVDYHEEFKRIKTIGKSTAGRGGMATKLLAVRKLTHLGINVLIGTYKEDRPVSKILCLGGGTLFLPKKIATKNRRKAWISTIVKSKAFLVVDQGAYQAICKNGSLLAIGIKDVHGLFKRGDVVGIKFKGQVFAVGISEYDGRDIKSIMGKKSNEIELVLGACPSEAIIHRDNMFIKQ